MNYNQLVKRNVIPTKTQIFGSPTPPEDPKILQLKKNFEKVRDVYAFDLSKSKFLI